MNKSPMAKSAGDQQSNQGSKVKFDVEELSPTSRDEIFGKKKSPTKTSSPSRKGHGRKKSRSPSNKRVKFTLTNQNATSYI